MCYVQCLLRENNAGDGFVPAREGEERGREGGGGGREKGYPEPRRGTPSQGWKRAVREITKRVFEGNCV